MSTEKKHSKGESNRLLFRTNCFERSRFGTDVGCVSVAVDPVAAAGNFGEESIELAKVGAVEPILELKETDPVAGINRVEGAGDEYSVSGLGKIVKYSDDWESAREFRSKVGLVRGWKGFKLTSRSAARSALEPVVLLPLGSE